MTRRSIRRDVHRAHRRAIRFGWRLTATALGLVGQTARAAPGDGEPSCPPGAFCEPMAIDGVSAETSTPATEPPDAAKAGRSPDDTQGPPERNPEVMLVLPPAGAHPRTIVVKQAPGRAPEVTSYEGEAPWTSRPPKRRATTTRKTTADDERVNGDTTWGLQLRGNGMLLPERRAGAEAPSMGGGGLSLRYRPVDPVAFDLGLDVLMGIDSNGYQRRETPLSMSMLLYLLSDSVVQPYAFFGVAMTHAEVESSRLEPNLARGHSDRYGYIGGHAGLGLDLRLASGVSLGLDVLGFVRERVDEGAGRYPEFYDRGKNEASNTTVAGQLRGGLTFWW